MQKMSSVCTSEIPKPTLTWSLHHGLSRLSPPLPEFFETAWFSLISLADGARDQGGYSSFWGFYWFLDYFWRFFCLCCSGCVKPDPVFLRWGAGCDSHWSWSGSPLSSCRSEVLCRLGNIACASEVVQMLLIYADILWALRFMSHCGAEDILRAVIACPASCLFWEIRLGILFRRTCSNNKSRQEQKTFLVGVIASACR